MTARADRGPSGRGMRRAKLLAGTVVVAVASLALVAQGPSRLAEPAGATLKDCPHCPDMVVVAPGSFVMGDESRRAADQQPPRRVTIARRIAYGKNKVSARDWKQCVLAGLCQSLGATGTSSLDPVVSVSWVDVQQYLTWLTLETGVEYRLLSEAEWEYVATRPVTGSPGFHAGGLEWTSDCWHADYAGAPTDGSSWDADGDCRYHVARGSRSGEAAPSVTRRYRVLFNAMDPALGFRVARTMPE